MPQITVTGETPFEAPEGKKLVLALEDAGIDILHRCGGIARCTTCRVEIVSGDVAPMEEAEREALETPEMIAQYRLSCQVRVQGDLSLNVWGRAAEKGMTAGTRPED
ncbi:MAG: (2Fe-2S)-binding protein [Armatimonadetes bacterium]|nr:(2Fe-2S)-binding protein [Armatimonadota bacterium]